VRAECVAEVLAGDPPATEVGSYLEKYREGVARIGFDPDGFALAYPWPSGRPRRDGGCGRGAYGACCHADARPFVLSVYL
jgi:hypothetical protein